MTPIHHPPEGRRPGSEALDTLLKRTRLTGAVSRDSFRVAGVPVLIAAVVSGGPGWTTYVVQAGDSLGGIARRHGTDARALARVNGLAGDDPLAAGRRLNVPVPPPPDAPDSSTQVRMKAAATGLHPVDTSGAPALTYRVRDGDTIAGIADRTGASVRAVLAANNLRPSALIRPGQLLVLPVLHDVAPRAGDDTVTGDAAADPAFAGRPGPTRTSPSTTARITSGVWTGPSSGRRASARPAGYRGAAPAARTSGRVASRPVVHVVRPGDTVSGVATRYRLSTASVLRANALGADSVIRPGSKLILPGATARPARPVGTTSAHVVKRGETVTAIAQRYGVSVSSVLSVNHLGERTAIYPGRRLLVPVGSARGTGAGRTAAASSSPPSSFLGRSYPTAVARAAAANRNALAKRAVPARTRVRELIRDTARRYHVDPALALAVASMESGFDQRQVSPANAIGVMQVLPSSGAWAGELIGRHLDLLDAAGNITAGVVLLASLLRQADEQTALAGYYQGLSSVRKNGLFADTRRYVATVRTLKLRFR